MGKFCRIIELENDEQVLLSFEYNEPEDAYEVSIATDIESCRAEIKLGFDSEEKALNVIETYTTEDAIKFRNEMVSFFDV